MELTIFPGVQLVASLYPGLRKITFYNAIALKSKLEKIFGYVNQFVQSGGTTH